MPAAPAGTAPDAAGGASAEVHARWLASLQRVAARAAHEINNALNGAVVNLEVVRIRGVAGRDAGAVAPFAASGAGQLEGAVRLVEALTALARAPQNGADVGATARQLVTLLAPAAAHDGVELVVDGAEGGMPTAAAPSAVRWAVADALLSALAQATMPASDAAEPGDLGGANPAPVTRRVVRCVLQVAPDPIIRIDSPASVPVAGDAMAVLRTCGIDVGYEGTALHLVFPPPAS